MAYDPKRVVVFGAAGLLLSAVFIMALQFSSMSIIPEIPVVQPHGLLIIKVRDKPAAELQELWMKIDEVRIHRVTEETDGESPWIDVTVVQTDRFDLLTLTDFSIVLATEELPTGDYNEIRLGIYNNPEDPEDEDNPYAIIDEEEVPLKVVANGKLMVKVLFTLREEGVTTIEVDIQVHDTSIIRSKTLHPVVKATVEEDGIGTSKPVQTHYMWGDDTETPTWSSEDDPITGVAVEGEVLRLRLSVLNDEGEATWSGVQLKLQYATDTEGDWYDVYPIDDTEGIWRYHNGEEEDKDLVSTFELAGSTIAEHFVESSPTETIVSVPIDDQGEWDVCIESNGADEETTYFFRFALSDGTPLYDYSEYPTLETAAGD